MALLLKSPIVLSAKKPCGTSAKEPYSQSCSKIYSIYVYIYGYTHIFYIHTLTHIRILNHQKMYYGKVDAQEDTIGCMGWLWSVGSIKL